METTKTTEKFKSVHQTFSYTPPSAWTNQWSSLAFGIVQENRQSLSVDWRKTNHSYYLFFL